MAMNRLVYLLFILIFLLNFFQQNLPFIPRSVTWSVELLTMLCAAIVALRFAVGSRFMIHAKYLFLAIAAAAVVLLGLLYNGTKMETLVIGIRQYFRFIPFFLLSAVYSFSENEFQKQLRILLAFALLQLPVSVFQRIYFFYIKHISTGDVVSGTILSSGIMSIFLICAISVWYAMYLKNRITLKDFTLIGFCLFLPCTINETKATLVLLPSAFLIPTICERGQAYSKKTRNLLRIAITCAICLAILIPVHTYFTDSVRAPTIFELSENAGKLREYFYRGEDAIKKGGHVRRFDAIAFACKDLAKDYYRLAFGYGMGNVSLSYFSDATGGIYAKVADYKPNSMTLTKLLWEFGISGVILYILFLVFVYQDARLLCGTEDIFGVFASGWCAVVIIMAVTIPYLNTIQNDVLSFLFWYFSGIMAGKALRYRALLEYRGLGRTEYPYGVRGEFAVQPYKPRI